MKLKLSVLLITLALSGALAQPAPPQASVASTKLGTNKVTFTVTGGERLVVANGLPDHTAGQFPNRGNPNTISAQNYSFHIPTIPRTNATPRDSRGWWFGVALNGVPFEPGTGEFWNGQREWNYEAIGGSLNLGIDQNNAHVQPTGAYHYHGLPTGLMAKLGGDSAKMLLVGWAADGFPIYTSRGHSAAMDAKRPLKKMRSSWQLKEGQRDGGPGGKPDGSFTTDYEFVPGSGDLDECNGRFGVTPEFPNGTYHYYITDEFPFLGRTFRGTPDTSFSKRMGGPGGPGGPNGRDPRGDRRGPPPPRP
jgi:hypothetical protein